MVQIQEEPRRGRGRPQTRSDEDTLKLIVQAAEREFVEKGFAGTCMGTVAQRAGISTKTIYRLVPTKADLFRNVVSDRLLNFMLTFDQTDESLEITAALEHILISYATFTLSEEVIAINRLVLSEGDRFPEIAAALYEGAIVRTGEALAQWLRRQCERGHIELDDPCLAAGMLRGMMIMDPQRAVMLGQRAAPNADEILKRAKSCAALFLKGCATGNA